MRLLISGYGGSTAGVYDFAQRRFVWQSGIKSVSYMCRGEKTVSGEKTANGEKTSSGEMFFGAGEHENHGFMYMFVSDGEAPGGYRLADTVRISGGAACHIAYSDKHKILTGACYGSGDVFSLEVKPGRFGEMKSYIRQGGTEAKVSRAHCAVFGPDENELFSANIALDEIFRYKIENGTLHETERRRLDKGIGPRHLKFINGRQYIITEYSNEIISPESNIRVSTLPDGFSGESFCSTLCYLPVNSEFGYMYAANRGADTIAVFKQNLSNGALNKIRDCGCGGKQPRHIEIISLKENPMLASANQKSGEIVFFKINKDGSLGKEEFKIPFEGASFVGELL